MIFDWRHYFSESSYPLRLQSRIHAEQLQSELAVEYREKKYTYILYLIIHKMIDILSILSCRPQSIKSPSPNSSASHVFRENASVRECGINRRILQGFVFESHVYIFEMIYLETWMRSWKWQFHALLLLLSNIYLGSEKRKKVNNDLHFFTFHSKKVIKSRQINV